MLEYFRGSPQSLISKIFGIYRVKLPGVAPIYLSLQMNCLNINPRNKMIAVFDMKGSMFNRQTLSQDLVEKCKAQVNRTSGSNTPSNNASSSASKDLPH